MSRPAPPPPPGRRPKTPEAAPSKKEQRKEQAKERKDKRRGPKVQVVPTLVMIALIVVAAVVYIGVRSARLSLTPGHDGKTVQAQAADATFLIPKGWKIAQQGAVSGGVSRYATGPAGARQDALFITRYPLTDNPTSDKQQQEMLAEAQASLQATGAGKLTQPQKLEVGGRPAWLYRFKHDRLSVSAYLVLREDDKQPTLYQLSCQSSAGAAGQPVREGCKSVIDTFKISS